MRDLTEQEMQADVDGGGWIADWVQSAINWYECHSKEIGEAYARMAADGMMGS